METGRPDPADAPPVTWPPWSYAVAAVMATLAAAWVLWPIPRGVMPRSADHMVHMARAAQLADELAQGQLRGWSDRWFFGTPGPAMISGTRTLWS